MTSLKELLNQKIRELGYLSAEQVYKICLEEGYKLSNAERRLRASESPDIEPVMAKSKRGTNYISGYKLQNTERTNCPECGFEWENKHSQACSKYQPVLSSAFEKLQKKNFPEKKIETLEVKGQLFTYKVQQPVWRDEG